jgi:hypothetical protein
MLSGGDDEIAETAQRMRPDRLALVAGVFQRVDLRA